MARHGASISGVSSNTETAERDIGGRRGTASRRCGVTPLCWVDKREKVLLLLLLLLFVRKPLKVLAISPLLLVEEAKEERIEIEVLSIADMVV